MSDMSHQESAQNVIATRSHEWVLRLGYCAKWLPDEEWCEEYVHYPKESDPDAGTFTNAKRRDIKEIGFSLLRWSGGKILDIGSRSAFRKLIERSNGGCGKLRRMLVFTRYANIDDYSV